MIDIDIALDNDGLLRLECPFCHKEFKVQNIADEIDTLYCPDCGLSTKITEFLTQDQLQMIQDIMYNEVVELINKQFKKSRTSLKKRGIWQVIEPLDFEKIKLNCCGLELAIISPTLYKIVYCPRCGDLLYRDS
jgi:transcription elongation factor Elf1